MFLIQAFAYLILITPASWWDSAGISSKEFSIFRFLFSLFSVGLQRLQVMTKFGYAIKSGFVDAGA